MIAEAERADGERTETRGLWTAEGRWEQDNQKAGAMVQRHADGRVGGKDRGTEKAGIQIRGTRAPQGCLFLEPQKPCSSVRSWNRP